MNRTRSAFLIAPLWVPLIVAPYSAIHIFPYRAQFLWVIIATALSAIFAYLGTYALGWPLFAFLKRRRLTAAWAAVAAGFAIGIAALLAFTVCLALFLGESRDLISVGLNPNAGQLLGFVIVGGIGALVGATLWVIARPDSN